MCYAQSPVEKHGRLTVANGKIVNEMGQEPQLRGVSLSWSVWGGKKYYTPEIVDWLVKDFKINLLRISMAIEPKDAYLQKPDEQYKLVTAVLDRALENGIYVLIDWHDHHANKNVEAAKVFFTKLAQQYQGNTQIIYEIWNEPERVSWQIVKEYAVEMIKTIREQDQHNVIVVSSPHWCQDVDIAAEDPILDKENIAYSFHFYASDPNHQGILRSRAEKAVKQGLPLFVTEWGVGEANGDGVFDESKTAIWLKWMEKNKLSWTNWNITDKEETTAILKPGASTNGQWEDKELTPAGLYIKEKLKKLNK